MRQPLRLTSRLIVVQLLRRFLFDSLSLAFSFDGLLASPFVLLGLVTGSSGCRLDDFNV